MQVPRFYVYEHCRADTGAVFYVGKGTGRRSQVESRHHRSEFWQRVVAKAGGFRVRFAVLDVDEELALLAERERIDQLRRLGVDLCNLTDGGDGTSGWVKTAKWRAKVGAAHRGKVVSADTRAKLSASVRASGYRHSEETRRRMSASRLGLQNTLGKRHSEDTKRKMREARARAPAPTAMTCPKCGKVGAGGSMLRWHFDRCREE